MTTTTTDNDRAEVFSRPAAQINEEGELVVRASSALGCRRSLWYSATGYQPTNPLSEESLTAMEAGNALEPVVVRAMERAGWKVDAADTQDPRQVAVRIGPNLLVTGHPDGTARMPLPEDEAAAQALILLFGDAAPAPAYGTEMVVEVKTRGPEAFRRWQTLGAERSHPASVAQGRLLLAGNLRRPAGRGDSNDGHRQSNLGLRGHPSRPAGEGVAGRLRVARRTGRAPRPERA